MLNTSFNNAPKILEWIFTRGGIFVWDSLSFNHLDRQLITPKGTQKPAWWCTNEPKHITSLKDITFHKDKEVCRLHVAIRISGNGMMLKCTDASSRKIRAAVERAGKNAYHIFDYETQEAVIFASAEAFTMEEWITREAPWTEAAFCIRNENEGIIDPEIKLHKFYRIIQLNVHIMDREPNFSVETEQGLEVVRPKQNFIIF